MDGNRILRNKKSEFQFAQCLIAYCILQFAYCSSMITPTQKHLSISPITGQELGKPSEDYYYNQEKAQLNSSHNKKSLALKDTYRSINPEELQHKTNFFLASKHQQRNYIQSEYEPEYHDEFCVCTDCVYERNLSKPSHSLFNLTMQTIYKQSFKANSHKNIKTNSPPHPNDKFSRSFNPKQILEKQSSLHPKQNVSLQTIYHQEMQKDTLPEKTLPILNQDHLKFEGPFTKLTTYSEKFPGIKGANPYVKPVDKAVRQNFNLNAKTINSTFYKGQMTERPLLARSPDNIKSGLPLLCKQTTSQKFYNPPTKSELYNKAYKSIPKKPQTINDKNQFASTYGKSFYGPALLEMVKHKKRLIRQTMSRLGM